MTSKPEYHYYDTGLSEAVQHGDGLLTKFAGRERGRKNRRKERGEGKEEKKKERNREESKRECMDVKQLFGTVKKLQATWNWLGRKQGKEYGPCFIQVLNHRST